MMEKEGEIGKEKNKNTLTQVRFTNTDGEANRQEGV